MKRFLVTFCAFAVCAAICGLWIDFIMVPTFRHIDDPGLAGVRMFYLLSVVEVGLPSILLVFFWTRVASWLREIRRAERIRARPSESPVN